MSRPRATMAAATPCRPRGVLVIWWYQPTRPPDGAARRRPADGRTGSGRPGSRAQDGRSVRIAWVGPAMLATGTVGPATTREVAVVVARSSRVAWTSLSR